MSSCWDLPVLQICIYYARLYGAVSKVCHFDPWPERVLVVVVIRTVYEYINPSRTKSKRTHAKVTHLGDSALMRSLSLR